MKGKFPLDQFSSLCTPFYYYDTGLLQKTLDAIKQQLKGQEQFRVHYAMKANVNPKLLSIIKDNGFGLSIINNEDGKTMFIMEIDKKYLKEAKNLIKSIDSNAFIVASETKFVSNGFIK